MPSVSALERRGAAQLKEWREKPHIFVREVFGITPDPWQDKVLEAFPHNQRIAMQACKGPGKTALLAWLAWNFLLTLPRPNVACTSVSGDNLRDGLMKEMAKWQSKSELLMAQFEWTVSRIFHKEYPADWWMSARTWPKTADAETQANTLAGLHADYIMFLLDESGSIPDAVMAAAEAALASCIRGHLVQAGNPTTLAGPLYRAATSERDLWFRVEITGDPDDPERSSRVSPEWARTQIRKYGRDHPFVKVNVFGQFPPQSLTALIGPEEVKAAMNRWYRPYEIGRVPKIIGIDVAREGDDISSIARRHGIQMLPLIRERNVLNGVVGASIANRIWNEFDADACFVDATGGLGFTWIDQLGVLGKQAIPVKFNGKAAASDRYANKRAEMYFRLVEWIKAGGALPPEDSEGAPELLRALTETNYTFHKDELILEDKEDIKAKLGFSPDDADAAALTFAEEVSMAGRTQQAQQQQRSAVPGYYDAFAEVNQMSATTGPRSAVGGFDPWRQ